MAERPTLLGFYLSEPSATQCGLKALLARKLKCADPGYVVYLMLTFFQSYNLPYHVHVFNSDPKIDFSGTAVLPWVQNGSIDVLVTAKSQLKLVNYSLPVTRQISTSLDCYVMAKRPIRMLTLRSAVWLGLTALLFIAVQSKQNILPALKHKTATEPLSSFKAFVSSSLLLSIALQLLVVRIFAKSLIMQSSVSMMKAPADNETEVLEEAHAGRFRILFDDDENPEIHPFFTRFKDVYGVDAEVQYIDQKIPPPQILQRVVQDPGLFRIMSEYRLRYLFTLRNFRKTLSYIKGPHITWKAIPVNPRWPMVNKLNRFLDTMAEAGLASNELDGYTTDQIQSTYISSKELDMTVFLGTVRVLGLYFLLSMTVYFVEWGMLVRQRRGETFEFR